MMGEGLVGAIFSTFLKECHKKSEPNPRLGSRILDLRTTQALARKEYTYTFNISCREFADFYRFPKP
jgi:hypothetical protein